MNQQYLFNIEYYKNEGEFFEKNNSLLTSGAVYNKSDKLIPLTLQSFVLSTLYPGLLVGTGYSHEWSDAKDKDNEIKLGFSLDYVTGLPYIPGSSIKGVLKSCFENYTDAVSKMLGSDEAFIKKLCAEVFGNNDSSGNDVFLDAIPIKAMKDGRVLGIDYITSHRSKLGPKYDGLTSPNPVRMLKVLPGVSFLFRFILKDLVIEDCCISSATRLELYKELLKIFGAGAKTNVGYGRFEESDNEDNKKEHYYLSVKQNKPKDDVTTDSDKRSSGKDNVRSKQREQVSGNYEIGKEYSGTVTGHNPKGMFAYVKLDDGNCCSAYDGGKKKENYIVTVVYKGKKEGKDGKVHDDWSIKGI